ncbi:two pore domain potassium channel family protein [Parahaliea aestuarii]|uniref:Two pore domain potassium channel family protein n=2 Tax=Parahaliea aestuarii TaxID=1852021 RepID=A0A5C8ZW43_9GAMM|nr:two pore domain potassium channel family protein [Parahaliea aestuarii]
MLMNFALGMATMAICLILQCLLLVAALRYYSGHWQEIPSLFLGGLRLVTGVMLVLIVGNIVQVSIWAVLFYLLGEFDTLQLALYHSGVNFATLGYGDIVMSEQHRILGPLEAIHGALMIGVSTAALSRAFGETLRVKTSPDAAHRD